MQRKGLKQTVGEEETKKQEMQIKLTTANGTFIASPEIIMNTVASSPLRE